MKKQHIQFVISALGLMAVCSSWAQGIQDVRLMPTKVALSDDRKSDTVLIVNNGTAPIRYRVSLVDKEMARDGSLIDPTASPANSAKNYIRVAPKEISLAPGAWQKIKLLSILPTGVGAGEYRVHLALTPINTAKLVKPISAGGDGQLKIQLEMQSGITIPIFISKGRLSASSKIAEVKLVRDEKGEKVVCQLERTGARTIRGNCLVTFTPDRGGKAIVISEARSVPLYYPNTIRTVTMPLNRSLAGLGAGTIGVQYSESESQTSVATLKVQSTSGK